MEKHGTWDKNSVIAELVQGKIYANELTSLELANSREACLSLLEKILGSYDNALAQLDHCMALLGNNNYDYKLNSKNDDDGLLLESIPINSADQDHSPLKGKRSSRDYHKANYVSKKRKTLSKWSELVRVSSNSDTGFEGQLEDGYNWRKYGQKDIYGATHPRAYYRCTHRHTQGCLATKKVQRSDDDPKIFQVLYKEKHSCMQEIIRPLKQQDAENSNDRQKKGENDIEENLPQTITDRIEPEPKEEISPSITFPSTPLIESKNPEDKLISENTDFQGTVFSSPETSDSYFDLPLFQTSDFCFLQSSESDFAEISSYSNWVLGFGFGDIDTQFLDDFEFS